MCVDVSVASKGNFGIDVREFNFAPPGVHVRLRRGRASKGAVGNPDG